MNAIEPYRRSEIKPGAMDVVQFAAGGVAADIRVERVDHRNRCIWYIVRIASSEAEVVGRLLGVLPGEESIDLGAVAVAPGSVSSARFSVTTPRTGPYSAMFFEIRSDQVLLRLDAPRPPSPRRGGTLRAGVACLALGAFALCGGMVALALPREPTLAVPARAVAGSQVRLAYSAGGIGNLDYAATSDDGAVVSTARLTAPTGEIAFGLPPASASHRISVAVSLHGPLGASSRSVSFPVVQPEPTPVAVRDTSARILSFSARRDQAGNGETILASYLAVGERGTIVLRDVAGKTVASAPFGHVGTSRIAVPAPYRTTPITATLTVHHGKGRAMASVVLQPNLVAESLAQAAAREAPPSTADAAEAVTPIDSADARSGQGLIGIEGRAVAGHPLKLRLMAQKDPMRVELEDDSGGMLAEIDLAPGQTHTVLSLPAAPAAASYFVALHYTHNGGEETVIRTVVASPR